MHEKLIIEAHKVRKIYRSGQLRVEALRSIDIAVAPGEMVAIMGPSGCGKTTLLRLIAGLEYPDGGSISIGGQDITGLPPRKRRIAMVFQSYAIFPHMTVAGDIAFALETPGAMLAPAAGAKAEPLASS